MTREAGTMLFTEGYWDDDVGQVLADHSVPPVAKGAFSCGVEFRDAALVIHGHNTIERRVQDRRFIGFAALKLCLLPAKPLFDGLALCDFLPEIFVRRGELD